MGEAHRGTADLTRRDLRPGQPDSPPVRRYPPGKSGKGRPAPVKSPAAALPGAGGRRPDGASAFQQRAARARERQEAAELERLASLEEARADAKTPPLKSADAEWADPEDAANTRSPKLVRGRARGAVLRRLHARGDDISRDALEASLRFQCAWDAARFGYTPAGGVVDGGGGGAGPRLAPPKHTLQREAHARDLRQVLTLLGAAAVPLLIGVVIEDLDVSAWCDREATRRPDGKRPDPRKALGRLSAILDRLAEYYGINERTEKVKAIKREMERR